MSGVFAALCMVSVMSDVTIHDEQVGRFVYKDIRVSENGNQTTVTLTIVNSGNTAQPVCSPVILNKTPTRNVFILANNKLSSNVPPLVPGKAYNLRFVYLKKGDGRLILYSGGFRGAATKKLYRY